MSSKEKIFYEELLLEQLQIVQEQIDRIIRCRSQLGDDIFGANFAKWQEFERQLRLQLSLLS